MNVIEYNLKKLYKISLKLCKKDKRNASLLNPNTFNLAQHPFTNLNNSTANKFGRTTVSVKSSHPNEEMSAKAVQTKAGVINFLSQTVNILSKEIQNKSSEYN